MRSVISCVQAVYVRVIVVFFRANLATARPTLNLQAMYKLRLIPSDVHTFFMQLCARLLPKTTDVTRGLYTLSTPLIISDNWVNKRNLLVARGGKVA